MRPDDSQLADLLAAVARRDRAAFRDLYGRTCAKLLGVALRIVRDRSVAEDVVQDAYVRVWQAAASFDPRAGRPMTWLLAIARHRAIDVIRQRRETVQSRDADDPDPLDAIPDPRDREAEYVEADRLRLCLDRLDPTQRDCFLDAYREGFSREELARRYDRPVNTIKTWLHRSAAALRTCLDAT